MWIVKNLLKGTLLVEDLKLKIAAGDYFDLDAVGREKADESVSLGVAFQEGYLQTIKKEGASHEDARRPTGISLPGLSSDDVARQLAEMRQLLQQQQQIQAQQQQMAAAAQANQMQTAAANAQQQQQGGGGGGGLGLGAEIREAFGAMTAELVGGIKEQMDRLASQRVAIQGERTEVIQSAKNMSEAEVRARLALLDSKENELKTNMEDLDRAFGAQTEGDGAAASMADLLDDL
ncbi:MAG: hypothetical protein AB7K09_14160 [Planctomycetota bacterium]